MKNNVKIYRAHRALGLVAGIFAVPLVLITLSGTDSSMLPSAVIAAILTIYHIAAAYGAKQGSNWARKLTKVYAILVLIGIPVGTIIGIYLLINSNEWDDERSIGG